MTTYQYGSRDDVVDTWTRLLIRRRGVRIPAGVKGFSVLPNARTEFDFHTNSYAVETGIFYQECSGEDMIFTPHLHLAPELRMVNPCFYQPYTQLCCRQGKLYILQRWGLCANYTSIYLTFLKRVIH